MSFLNYLENKIFYILFQITTILFITVILALASIPFFYIAFLFFICIFLLIIYLVVDYLLIQKRAKRIIDMVDNLEEKYYISEILPKSSNLENIAYRYALEKACKAMNDRISNLEQSKLDYQEYIESFVHEVKTPIAALSLIFDDTKDKISKKEIDKIDNYIDQVLYYARSNTTEKDYFVKELDLSSVIHNVLLKYRDYLLEQKIKITTTNLEKKIYTDEKWLQFVISQIIQNSIKYMDKSKKEIIITGEETKENITLTITDNGCGIKESDISRVFEKGFTGSNRGKESSTGIGLYLAKKICVELGLTISIQSIYKEKTTVKIIFPITDFNKFE